MSRTNIQEDNKKNNDLRNSRSENRDEELKVIMPDGTVLIRRPTEELGKKEGKLAIPEKKGFYRRWVKNEIQGNLQKYIDLGFVPATDINCNAYEPIRGGVRKNNTEYKLYPLEIPTKELERIREKNEELDPTKQALKNQEKWLQGQHVDGLTYNPQGRGNTVTERTVSGSIPIKKQ